MVLSQATATPPGREEVPGPSSASRHEARTCAIGAVALMLFLLLGLRAAMLPTPAGEAAAARASAPATHAVAHSAL